MQHHGAALRELTSDDLPERLVRDWRSAQAGERLHAMLTYAEKLTRAPGAVARADLAPLAEAGLDDEAILHLCEVVAYFNFVNRMAEGLGVELDGGWPHPILEIGRDDTSR